MVLLFLIGVSVYVFEGCAGNGKLELWEGCARPAHEHCQEVQGYQACMDDYYLECIGE